jgi:hypothetical protein
MDDVQCRSRHLRNESLLPKILLIFSLINEPENGNFASKLSGEKIQAPKGPPGKLAGSQSLK